uniref:Uncharacterized protein n=1 Tax=Cacopsylla melanoneura TaxID=428564 RepID=A0A8D8ULB1_9HEMI
MFVMKYVLKIVWQNYLSICKVCSMQVNMYVYVPSQKLQSPPSRCNNRVFFFVRGKSLYERSHLYILLMPDVYKCGHTGHRLCSNNSPLNLRLFVCLKTRRPYEWTTGWFSECAFLTLISYSWS